MKYKLCDLKPVTPITQFNRSQFIGNKNKYDISVISDIVGMSPTFIRKATGQSKQLSCTDIVHLLEQDAFSETFIPRSKVYSYLSRLGTKTAQHHNKIGNQEVTLLVGNTLELINQLPDKFIDCLVTSTPYWGTRLYDVLHPVNWADEEVCPFGMEQTPESFIRHTTEILMRLKPVMKVHGSIWWNIMDSYNTRTQIRSNAVEALRAMQGHDKKSWSQHACRRYSAGHSYLKDGEQCLIPMKIAERASRMGYYVKSVISWVKSGTTPEPQNSRVSRNVEYILHLTLNRTPKFSKAAYKTTPAKLGGKNTKAESDKLSDVWYMSTSSGQDGHGAQFPLSLPGRCIALSTKKGDIVLDPFVGSGTSAVAAKLLGRRFIGFEINENYVAIARKRLEKTGKDK